MNSYPFGKPFKLIFNSPLGKEPDLAVTPDIYIFKDQPTITAAKAGTGNVKHIEEWERAEGNTPQQITINVPVIDDPDPNSNTNSYTYYVAVNYKADESGALLVDIKPFIISRINNQLHTLNIKVSDVMKVFPSLDCYLTEEQIQNFITDAFTEVKIAFLKVGHHIEDIYNLDEFYLALAYKAVANCSFSQVEESGDKFDRRFEVFNDKYDGLIKGLKIVSVDTSGSTTKVSDAKNNFKVIIA